MTTAMQEIIDMQNNDIKSLKLDNKVLLESIEQLILENISIREENEALKAKLLHTKD